MDVGIMEARKLFCTQQLLYFLISHPGRKQTTTTTTKQRTFVYIEVTFTP